MTYNGARWLLHRRPDSVPATQLRAEPHDGARYTANAALQGEVVEVVDPHKGKHGCIANLLNFANI